MQLTSRASRGRCGPTTAILAAGMLLPLLTMPAVASAPTGDPFKVVDPQHVVNQDDMTWDDFKEAPGTNWGDPSQQGSVGNRNFAILAVDYADKPFVVTQSPRSNLFGNPMPEAANIKREDVPVFWRDFYNKPSDLNHGITLHGFRMEDSQGRLGANLTAFGPYQMPKPSFAYGIDPLFNWGDCPKNQKCDGDIPTDAQAAWRADVGNKTADLFDHIIVVTAGEDESSTWLEFGAMKFASKDDIPDEFGPPAGSGLPNFAVSRYTNSTSWQAAANFWGIVRGSDAETGIKVYSLAEGSGLGNLQHLLDILDIGNNYNDLSRIPPQRTFAGPFSAMAGGNKNGPGGPHTCFQIPTTQGGAVGSLHTVRERFESGLIAGSKLVNISREALPASGLVVTRITARAVISDVIGLRVEMDKDFEPPCDENTETFCDGGGYKHYYIEVIDRMGRDSFQPDHGVMISKTRQFSGDQMNGPNQWVIDANPQDIGLVDYISPNGTTVMVTVADSRQLNDALFHAGTRSGSQFEFVDKPNSLHFYVLEMMRDSTGVLSYTVGVRSLKPPTGSSVFGVKLAPGSSVAAGEQQPTGLGVFCSFPLTNNGTYGGDAAAHPQDLTSSLRSDIFRLDAKVEGSGWRIVVPNAVIAAKFGETVSVNVAVAAAASADDEGVVTLKATSESDEQVTATAECRVPKNGS